MSQTTVSISQPAFEVLSVLDKQPEPLTIKAIAQLLPPEFQALAKAGIVGLANRKAIKKGPLKDGKPSYSISAAGRAIVKLPNDLLEITPPKLAKDKTHSENKRGPYKKKSDPAATPPAPALNLSKSTNAAVDVLSAVINENHELRELMTRVASQIAAALGLQIVQPQGE